jgi:aspartate aminotransferase-like enzyme
MVRSSQNHTDPEFNLGVLDATCEKLREVFQTDNDVFIMPGSGRCAVESAITSVIEPNDRVLTIVAGVFGRWMKQMVERVGGIAVESQVEWGQSIDLARLEETLHHGNFKALTIVHNESSTGAMYPIDQIGQICHHHSVLFIVDAVSSFGGVNIETDKWHLDLVPFHDDFDITG